MKWQLQDVLTIVGLAFAYLVGLREFAKITNKRLRWLSYSLATTLFAVGALLFLFWPAPNKMLDADRTPTPVPTSTAALTPTQPPSSRPAPSPTPTVKFARVLLPAPTKLEIVPTKWFTDSEGQAIWQPRNCGYINEAGVWELPAKWDPLPYYYIDTRGEFVLNSPAPSHGDNFVEGLAGAKDMKTHHWGFVNTKGTFVIPARYYLVEQFSEGLASVMFSEDRCGFINHSGEPLASAVWSSAGHFSEGLAPVSQGGRWGYIDKSSNLVIPLRWSHARSFYEGVATVRNGTVCSLIDKKGAILVETDFDYIGRFSNGVALARRNGMYGFINKAGREVSRFEWEKIIRDEPQGDSRKVYWCLARSSGPDSATIVWFDPDLKEIWRGKIPLLALPY